MRAVPRAPLLRFDMGFELRPGLHFCETTSGFIFLDLEKDRYFRLPARLENRFRDLLDEPLSVGSSPPYPRTTLSVWQLPAVSRSQEPPPPTSGSRSNCEWAGWLR